MEDIWMRLARGSLSAYNDVWGLAFEALDVHTARCDVGPVFGPARSLFLSAPRQVRLLPRLKGQIPSDPFFRPGLLPVDGLDSSKFRLGNHQRYRPISNHPAA